MVCDFQLQNELCVVATHTQTDYHNPMEHVLTVYNYTANVHRRLFFNHANP